MGTKIDGIRYQSEHFDKVQGLMSCVNAETLVLENREQSRKKAVGVDGVSKDDYFENLGENIQELVRRLKAFSYRPQPVRRTYIPKANGKLRPLGIPAYEDKLVQGVMAKILTATYEPRFLDVSYGFRPGRSAHDAIAQINSAVMSGQYEWVLEADIKGFFDNVNHDMLMDMLKHDIDDKNFLRYVKRFLKAGVMEDGEYSDSDRGTPQGGLISPVLANVYLHYVLDQWFCRDIMPRLKGKAQYIRYADDFIILFQYEYDARRVMEVLGKRLGRFDLELAEDKTRIARIGKNAKKEDQFDFLGFTFYKAKTRSGKYRLGIRTSEKKLKAKRQAVKKWVRERINKPLHNTLKMVARILRGHYNYYGVNGNLKALQKFRYYIAGCLKRVLCRRSQKGYVTWEKFIRMWDMNIPQPCLTKDIWHWEPKTN